MSMNPRPTDLPPTPPTAPGNGGAVPTAEPCVECGTTDGWTHPEAARPWRGRRLCSLCYGHHYRHDTLDQFSLVYGLETFEGFPPGYTHAPTGWPVVPALVAPLHPPLPAPNRWGNAIWFRRPQHDPVGQRLFDRETRYTEAEAA